MWDPQLQGVVDARCYLFPAGSVLGSASVAIPSFRRISCVALIGSVPRKGAVTHTLKKGNEPTPGYNYIICQHTCKGQSVSSVNPLAHQPFSLSMNSGKSSSVLGRKVLQKVTSTLASADFFP